MILIGIDPGVVTGFARWDATEEALLTVTSMGILGAMEVVANDMRAVSAPHMIILEDCREMRIGGGDTYGQTARLQGVGSVKRDCQIWHDFLTRNAFPFIAQKPQASLTKWKAERFRATTGWQKVTNEHARDAALLVYGITESRANILMQTARRAA